MRFSKYNLTKYGGHLVNDLEEYLDYCGLMGLSKTQEVILSEGIRLNWHKLELEGAKVDEI